MDRSDDEFAIDCSGRIFNCIETPHLDASGTTRFEGAPYADAVDLREEWWNIGDQGKTGACVGWATADSVLRWHFVDAGKLHKDEELSVRFTWIASKEQDAITDRPTTFIETSGTMLRAALDVSLNYGAIKASFWPGTGELYKGEEKDFFYEAARLRIGRYHYLDRRPAKWREWLGNGGGPILTRLNVDSVWINATSSNGWLDGYDRAGSKCGGHAVALVGYTENSFIVRNSWGTNWGDNGFAYATDSYATDAFTEAWGVEL